MNTPATVKVAVAGAAGRMGRRLCALAVEMDGLELVAACDRPDHPMLGRPAAPDCPVMIADTCQGPADVLVDFTSPSALQDNLRLCVEQQMAAVIGTTGLAEAHFQSIDHFAQTRPVLWASNFSLGVNWLSALVAQTARRLGDDYDIEILEAHHRHKQDAPSGTALALAQALCDATGKSANRDVQYTRTGQDPRQSGQITIQALRMGDVVGEHTVFFAAPGERLELKHVASTRDTFARGALKVARWIAGQSAGRYHMTDVLGL